MSITNKPKPDKAIRVFTPSVVVPTGDGGHIVKPGKPILLNEEISVKEASRILGLSQRRIIKMCAQGKFIKGQDWNQPNPKGKRFLDRGAVLKRKGLL